MLDEKIVDKLRKKYSDLHPLLFQRSVERAKSNGDLFDIVDTVPHKYPLMWNEKENRWSNVADPYFVEQFLSDFNQKNTT
jgi:hypothetical protein